MPNIPMLRTLVQNGWTRSTRKLFEQRLGKEQFDMLKKAYTEFQEEAPIFPKAATEGKDVYLSFSIPINRSDCPFNLSELPQVLKNKFQKGIQDFVDSFFPKFKNEEICLESIGERFQHLDLEKIDKTATEEELYKALGFTFKKESFNISDLIKIKHTGNTAKLKKDSDFTSEVVSDTKSFWAGVGKLFGQSEKEIREAERLCKSATHYTIKQNGQTVGFFSLNIRDGVLEVGNYALYPQFRNTRASMNSILAVRDKIIEEAQKSGIKTVKAEVDANNPKLLGLYKRFGFQPNYREFYSFKDKSGEIISSDTYNLIGYLN